MGDQTEERKDPMELRKKKSQEAGALVYLTRYEDADLSSEDAGSLSRRKSEDIRNRVQYIDEKEADFYLSIHLNAIPSPKWRGAQTFYNPNVSDSEHLAKFIQSEIKTNLENTTREALGLSNIYLLRHVKAPGALVEAGFLSNSQERELLKSDEYQRKVSASIYQGVLRYVTEREYPSSD
jgi:N-acetylmuramoyl-L-alanine amidase